MEIVTRNSTDDNNHNSSGPSGERGPSRHRAAAYPRLRGLHRLRASPGRGANENQSGLIVGRATQVVTGASFRARVSPESRKNLLPVELLAASSRPAPPSVTQDDAPSLHGIKDHPACTAERYRDVFTLPLAGMFTGGLGSPEIIKGCVSHWDPPS